MSEAAERSRDSRRRWAVPGSSHDRTIRLLRVALPMGIGALFAFLSIAPLTIAGEMSFMLDKNKVEVAKERLRVTEALYRGEDAKGQSFALRAGSAVQATSREPIVRLQDLSASLSMQEGPALLRADRARYDMDKEAVAVEGPVTYQSADGYRLVTRDVNVDLKTRRLASQGQVEGRMPLGTFSGGRISADLPTRVVRLEGRARLHIVQGAAR
ncbi:LPS export ABC transporter periplasmic protein LptC [Sphingomonas sp. ID1715]|uniref:LPS export ABC transporter periplasmic protein LptC n=1 Tax=Sphingomonas sp. ID1715 TaxID=1656898 RepID=UPI00148940EB|nr:LPS export ABC transporter periplasmic protein LptC [Sphingomonas sp. ID1715]NNM77040.1 LPS export ABC transporter periplasmic protein LptC [Sphingomonas sp. ID1715]